MQEVANKCKTDSMAASHSKVKAEVWMRAVVSRMDGAPHIIVSPSAVGGGNPDISDDDGEEEGGYGYI
jgi:hypothetical protein